MKAEMEAVLIGFKEYWNEDFETRASSESCAMGRALWLLAKPMRERGEVEDVKNFLEAWDYVWGNGVGPCHPKWWDSRISALRSELRIMTSRKT